MKVPVEWLRQYVDTNKNPKEMAETLTSLGLLLDKPIGDGKVLDLEHRMDRSDWLSILGVARDFAAYEGIRLKEPERYQKRGKRGGGVKIEVQCPEIVRRFNTRVFRNIKVQESPEWLKRRLTEYGMTPINNIVDITNYVMVELGNPMHAQDLSKFAKQEIIIRRAKDGEKITTLDGSVVELDSKAFVLTQNNEPIVIGGIVGGVKTSVDARTTDIILDAGNYDQSVVRKTARRLKIQNETVSRYDKFLHPKLTEIAIERATKLILELAGGEYYENTDYYPSQVQQAVMTVRASRIAQLSGMQIDDSQVKEILTRLGYKILKAKNGNFTVEVPYFRTDVEVEDDIVSDILRINGYHKIPVLMTNSAPPQEITPDIYKYEDKIRDILVKLGLHEHITDPLLPADESNKKQVKLENSQSAEKNSMRTDIFETLFPVTGEYKKHGIKEVGVFEIGKAYSVEGDRGVYENYHEKRVLEVIYVSELQPLENAQKVKELYYGLLYELGIDQTKPVTKLQFNRFTVDIEELMKHPEENFRVVDEYQNKVTEDISVTVPMDKPFGPVFAKIKNADPKIVDIYVVDEYLNVEEYKRSVLVRIEFLEKETSKEEIALIKNKILDQL
jgi:phenylalanyl-tRNA synthetase beta subunit